MTTTRLNKFIAHSAGLSRREADDAIALGRVMVNGIRAELGTQVGPDDIVMLDKTQITESTHYTYIALHKPVGYVCSRRAQGDTSTIYSLLPADQHNLKAVGRLDKDSSGILLLTDDGDFAHSMTHPKFHKTKSYLVTLDAPLAPLHHQMINDIGVQLEDGRSQLQLEKMDDDAMSWRITMHEGRNRQIRRTFSALGYTVVTLHRTQFGPYSLGELQSGKTTTVNP
ncbi:MAG: pseudouridine synthase [Candidatus Saccharimonadales bacterium]